jgi:hypothetical protein
MNLWNTRGAFMCPNVMTFISHRPSGSNEGCQPLISLSDANLVVARLHIKLGEYAQSLYLIHDLINAQEGI